MVAVRVPWDIVAQVARMFPNIVEIISIAWWWLRVQITAPRFAPIG